jgi:hypothetical protein
MTKHVLRTGISLIAYGYRTGRDLHWYVFRRPARA